MEALERARAAYGTGAYDDATIEFLFPEVKESGDEWIRKWLIEMVEELRKANPTNAEHNGNCSEAIAYLEKQKPLSTAEWSEEEEAKITFLERLIRYNVPEGQYGWVDGHKGGFVTKLEAISILKSLRPSWKPCEEQMEALKEAYESYDFCDGERKALESLYEQLKQL